MSLAAANILPGAKGRLLPPSIPFGFFGAAICFHILLWLVAIVAAGDIPTFRGGLGHALGALHFLTLGVLTTTAMGAAFQLLPVATRQPLLAIWPARVTFFLFVPGVLSLVHGMGEGDFRFLDLGAFLAVCGLLGFAILVADNLRRASSLGVVAAHGWVALASLIVLLSMGLLLVFDFQNPVLRGHGAVAGAHAILGLFGFMGTLLMGFSYILLPMFALAEAVSERLAFGALSTWSIALVAGSAGALTGWNSLIALAAAVGIAATALHLVALQRVLRKRMRKRLGISFMLVRMSWALLCASLAIGALAALGLFDARGMALFGFVAAFGWLLTFLLGVLQRILPFLGSMHAAKGGRPPLVSELTNQRALTLHATCHLAALAAIATGIVFDAVMLVRLGAVAGLLGALAFAWFGGTVIFRVTQRSASKPTANAPVTER